MHMQDLAARLEQAGHSGEAPEVLAPMAEALCTEYARVAAYLQDVLASRQ